MPPSVPDFIFAPRLWSSVKTHKGWVAQIQWTKSDAMNFSDNAELECFPVGHSKDVGPENVRALVLQGSFLRLFPVFSRVKYLLGNKHAPGALENTVSYKHRLLIIVPYSRRSAAGSVARRTC